MNKTSVPQTNQHTGLTPDPHLTVAEQQDKSTDYCRAQVGQGSWGTGGWGSAHWVFVIKSFHRFFLLNITQHGPHHFVQNVNILCHDGPLSGAQIQLHDHTGPHSGPQSFYFEWAGTRNTKMTHTAQMKRYCHTLGWKWNSVNDHWPLECVSAWTCACAGSNVWSCSRHIFHFLKCQKLHVGPKREKVPHTPFLVF